MTVWNMIDWFTGIKQMIFRLGIIEQLGISYLTEKNKLHMNTFLFQVSMKMPFLERWMYFFIKNAKLHQLKHFF